MRKSVNSSFKRLVLPCITAALLLSAASAARANTVYDVSGTFGTTFGNSSLGGGTFSGTFSASLPFTSGENITTFNINLFYPSGSLGVDLTNSTAGDFAFDGVLSSNCWNGATAGSCDYILFSNSSGSDYLELIVPTAFAGGAVVPTNPGSAIYSGSFVGFNGGQSTVTQGSIEPVPESGSLLLLGIGLLAGLWLERKQIFARSPGSQHAAF